MTQTTLDLNDDILQALHRIANALEQQRPAPVQHDFSAHAYVWKNQHLQPIYQPRTIYLNDLKGIDIQKQKLVQNTRQFLHGLPANDVLLTGARGTGKSSLVRALLTEYAEHGLRLIEIERDDLKDLPLIQKQIQQRSERYIVYCDDMAFNQEDENYRSLKSVLDGSLQSGSSNMLIYATSNRRHLLPEFMHENTPIHKVDVPQYHELHPQEAIEEKISLSDRFGLWLSFYPTEQDLYLQIVQHWLQQANLPFDAHVQAEALRWSQMRGQRSGRAAYQFAKHWIGQTRLQQSHTE